MIHDEARAGFGQKSTHRALYVLANKTLKHKLAVPMSFTALASGMSESERN